MSREVIGTGSIHQLHEAVGQIKPKRVLIVTGKGSYSSSGAKEAIEEQLKNYTLLRYSDFEENPKFQDLLKGVKLREEFEPDLIVAVGGGSVMDTAKMISVLPSDPAAAKKIVMGEVPVPVKIAPLVMIPTTSGSGSEATKFAVVYLNDSKYSVVSEGFLPEYVFLDPELTYSLSPYQTAVSGMDALCQAVESFWAASANKESRNYAGKAINLALMNLEKSVNEPDDQSRLEMMIAANFAGKAINITRTTASHAMSYALTAYHGIPHGHAVALTLGEFFVFNMERAVSSSREELIEIMDQLFELFGCKDADQCREKFYDIMKTVGLETKLEQLVSGDVDLPHLVKEVNIERLNNHPIKLTEVDVESVYRKILR